MSNKLTKTVIKDIVKECLLEILAEGLASNSSESNANKSFKKSRSLKETMNQISNKSSRRKAKLPNYLEDVDRNLNNDKTNLLKTERLHEIAAKLTNDPILSEMLVDTAQTTLQEQSAAESNKHFVPTGAGDHAQKTAESKDPEELFGTEASSKWASLAFG